MTRRQACSLLLLLSACTSRRERAESAYQDVWTDFRRGNLRLAERRVDRAIAATAPSENAPATCKLKLLRAEVLLAQGRAKEALPLVERPVCDGAEDAAFRLRRQVDCADALSKLDRNPEAVALLDQAERELGAAATSETWYQIQVLRGAILVRTNQAPRAEEVLRRAVARAAREGNEYQRGAALINLSFCKIRQFRFDEALPYCREALAASERARAGRFVAVTHINLGIVHARLGDFERAESHQSLAVKSLGEIDDRRNLMEALGELGNLQLLRGNPDAAAPSFEQAFKTALELNAILPASRWAGNLASALADAGRFDEAERWNNEARALKERVGDRRGLVLLKEIAAVIAAGRKQNSEAERLLRETIAGADTAPYLLWQARARLGSLYLDTGRPAAANAEFESALNAIEAVRTDLLQSEFKLTFLARLISFFQQYVDALVSQGQMLHALQVAEYSRARVLAERLGRSQTRIAAIQPRAFQDFARRNKAVLVSYWVAPRRSFVWVVRPDGIRHAVLPSEPEIATLTASFRRLVEDDLRDPLAIDNAAVSRLAECLLAEPRKHAPAGSRVFLVPDGVLHRINFETLPVPGERHYLLDDWSLAIAPSLSVLTGSTRDSVQGSGGLLLVGAPAAQGTDYPALPKAGEEIGAIQRHLAKLPAEVYVGARATPKAFRESQPERFSLIHFAAHAETNRESPLDSAVVLSRDGDEFKLYARDVRDAKLTANLVTISACRSAGARAYGGEGMVGLAWAFLHAGSRAVIAGLWDVSDSSTAALMDRLYKAIAAGEAPEDALRTAKLALRRGPAPFNKPYYWGPLEAYVRAPRLPAR